MTFLLNWVILKRLRFTQGYPMPMYVDGGCMCGETLCKDVLFTFNVNIEDAEHNATYHKKWMATQYYDREQGQSHMIAPATKLEQDRLVTGISLTADIDKLKGATVDQYVKFKATDTPHLLYDGLGNEKAHFVCSSTFNSKVNSERLLVFPMGPPEYGTDWKVNPEQNCERTVDLKVVAFHAFADPPYMRFANTLARLHFPNDGSNPVFVSPVCKQGPQLFLSAGLRGTITLVEVNQSPSIASSSS